jgi:hypothetical protein
MDLAAAANSDGISILASLFETSGAGYLAATRAQVLRQLEGRAAAFEERGRRDGYRVERLPG